MDESTHSANLSVPTSVTPPDAEPFELPGEPKLPKCPVCQTGFLYAIASDPDALHEDQPKGPGGDPKGHAHFIASGGSLTLRCFNCGITQTQPLNADPDEKEAALAAAEADAAIEARASGAK